MFSDNGDYLYFNVLFTQEEYIYKNDFILGKPFFKKYPMVFDFNEKIEKMGFYQNLLFKKNEKNNTNTQNKDTNEMPISDSNSKKSNVIIWILIFIGIIIICLLAFIINRYLRRPRKQKVNELIEFFDYSSVQKKI